MQVEQRSCAACGEPFKAGELVIDMYPPMHHVCPWAASLAGAVSGTDRAEQ